MNSSVLINPGALRVGMYIKLEVGWMRHPFPVSSFRIATAAQLRSVQALGLEAVRYFPGKSDRDLAVTPLPPATEDSLQGSEAEGEAPSDGAQVVDSGSASSLTGTQTNRHFSAQVWQHCDERYRSVVNEFSQLQARVQDEPAQALAQSHALVTNCIQEILPSGDLMIRLLSEGSGQRQSEHPVSVTALCLLLGRVLGMSSAELYDLGMSALLHDIGKDPQVTMTLPREVYERHVGDSVALASSMGLSSNVLTAIAQHHEFVDGSGFPLHLLDEDLSQAGKVLALVNCYDRLCNPEFAQEGLTPHEALATLYAQLRPRFDPVMLRAFIRMMGIYPPGSVVQLVDGRFAMVMSVNSSRPLKPQVLVYDPEVSLVQAQPLDLEMCAGIGIRRSLRPEQLPYEALSYLSPLHRICYFFERAVDPGISSVTAP